SKPSSSPSPTKGRSWGSPRVKDATAACGSVLFFLFALVRASGLLIQRGDDALVQQPVGGHRGTAVRARLALDVGEGAAGLRHDRDECREIPEADLRLRRDVHGTLGDHHVGPEVPESAQAPGLVAQAHQLFPYAAILPDGQGAAGEA